MRIRFAAALVAASLLAGARAPAAAAQQPAKQRLASVQDALVTGGVLSGRSGPESVNWIDAGRAFSYAVSNQRTRSQEIHRFDPATLKDDVLVQTSDLVLPGRTQPLAYESFQWALDSKHLVLQTDFRPIYRYSGLADYYVYSLADKSLKLAADDARTAELSPDGSRLGYERGGDLFVYDLNAGQERRLTTVGSDSIFAGVFDWVYEEEFSQTQAWKWSPDSRKLAFWQTDERGVPPVQITDYESQHPAFKSIAYPKVGDHNPVVRIGILDATGGAPRWLDLGEAGEFYVPRIYWTAAKDTLAVVVMNRPQNDLKLLFLDVNTGARRVVLEETSPTWIDISDFFAQVQDYFTFPAGSREFFWLSDRDGHQHIYRYDYAGKLIAQVTQGPWVVTRVEAIDPQSKTIYYSSTEASVLERQLYSIRFDGTGEKRLTQTRGTHAVNVSPAGGYYLDSWQNTQQPKQVELWSTAGKKLSTLEANAGTTQWLQTHVYAPTELFKFTTTDGVQLDGSMVKPPDFDPARKYPVLLSIYGGPGSQQVSDEFGSDGWAQYLAQQGYIVVGLNNRGSGNYGRDFMKMVYRKLGEWESKDFAEVARFLAAQPYVDGSHIGIHGTSYGGYMSIYTMLRYPDLFALGMANSPVTDWTLYDTIYTERYMGLLASNAAGYQASSTLPIASRLQGHLLLVHSAMDENVQVTNTMQLLTALAAAGKDVELRFYPPGTHGAAFDFASYVTMNEVYTNEICQYLGSRCVPTNPNKP